MSVLFSSKMTKPNALDVFQYHGLYTTSVSIGTCVVLYEVGISALISTNRRRTSMKVMLLFISQNMNIIRVVYRVG
jgi:hypothetical protein